MTPIEIMALVMAVVGLIKMTYITISPKSWMPVVRAVYGGNGQVLQWIGLALTIGTLYYLLQVLTIVELFASMWFLVAIMLIGIGAFSKDLLAFAEKLYKRKDMLSKCWMSMAVWVVLCLWVLKELFF